jgi:hypothetical protein
MVEGRNMATILNEVLDVNITRNGTNHHHAFLVQCTGGT